MIASEWYHGTKNTFEKLQVEFDVPDDLNEQIDELIYNLNNEGGNLADCYEQEIRSTLNCCEDDLTEDQILLLRNYYCRGGIYNETSTHERGAARGF